MNSNDKKEETGKGRNEERKRLVGTKKTNIGLEMEEKKFDLSQR